MSDIWFSSDHHFKHEAIIKYCDRPFTSSEEMDEVLIERWNKFVAPRDVVIYLGDFIWSDKELPVLKFVKTRLNGAILFIKGNHDRWYKHDKRYMYNKKIRGLMVWGCHYPLRNWPSGVNLHGHCHGTIEEYPNQFDVGVDVWDYRPVNIEEIKNLVDPNFLTRKQRGETG